MRNLLSASLFVLAIAVVHQAKEWCNIVPLHSTREDVERVLNVKPQRCGGNACLYDLVDKTVFVLYSGEPTCKNTDVSNAWNVPRDTVIEITVHYKTPQPLSLIEPNLTKYKRVQDKEFPALVYLTNDVEGVQMETSGDTVREITYYRSERDSKLRCPKKF